MSLTTFDQIAIGRTFKTSSNIVYQKTSAKEAIAIQKADGTAINNGLVSTMFYNTSIKLTPL